MRRLFAAVAQLDRASVYGTEGRRFESCRPRQETPVPYAGSPAVLRAARRLRVCAAGRTREGSSVADDEQFMAEAMAEAELAARAGDVPVGCVLVRDGAIIARAHNLRQ